MVSIVLLSAVNVISLERKVNEFKKDGKDILIEVRRDLYA
jgi:hypothetical protein